MRKIGSNQYQYKYGLSKDAIISVWAVAFFTLAGVNLVNVLSAKVTSPCPDTGCNNHFIKTVYAKESKTELQEITEYIVKKFEPEGRQVAVKALACFISESGLRNNAVGVNKNGTNDVGVAQINSIHGMSTEDRMDYKKNIDKAYQIYKSRGWKAWYGAYCK